MSNTPTAGSDSQSSDELRILLYSWTDSDDVVRELEELLIPYTAKREVAAQTNAVAWAVGVLDDMHFKTKGLMADSWYKGAKNTLRSRYETEVGIDPAPNYPIKAALQKGNKE